METLYEDFYQQLNIPVVQERNYWLVRSNGGEYYDDFTLHNYIALAWDYVNIAMLNNKSEEEIKALIEMNERSQPTKTDDLTEEEVKSSGVVTSIYNKIIRFVKEFKIGDVVLVPSKNSESISIGIIKSEAYEDPSYMLNYLNENPNTELKLCPYHKRRKVEWLKHIPKFKLDIYLIKAFSSHHAISSINDHAEYIDRTLYPIYRKKDEVHSVIHAGHPNGFTLRELVELSRNYELSIMDLCEQLGIEYNYKDYNVKINIHSPGLMEFIGYGAMAGIALSIFMFSLNHLFNGGKFKIGFKRDEVTKSTKFILESETKGFKGRELDFKELELKQQVELKKLAESLQIKSPEFNDLNSEQKED
jgi:predicted Mrr-cat superfamily restriction endonuclease